MSPERSLVVSILAFASAALASGCATGQCATPQTTTPPAAGTEPAEPASPEPAPQAQAPAPAPEPMPADRALATVEELPATPALSPAASVEQTVGVTDMKVTYSSPAVRDREIWGGLVPYDEKWRTGANAPTRIRFSSPVTFGGEEVPAGEYSLLTVPGESEWTVILNTDPEKKGVYGHDEELDVARVKVEPEEAPTRERMTFLFLDTTETGTRVALEWAGLRVAIPVEVDTEAVIAEQIDRTVEATWHVPYNIGRYHLENEDHEKAVEWLKRSVDLHDDWRNHWFLAEALKAQGEEEEAEAHIRRALEVGEGNPVWERAFKERAEKALEQ